MVSPLQHFSVRGSTEHKQDLCLATNNSSLIATPQAQVSAYEWWSGFSRLARHEHCTFGLDDVGSVTPETVWLLFGSSTAGALEGA